MLELCLAHWCSLALWHEWVKEGRCLRGLLASHPRWSFGALDIARKKTFFTLSKKTMTAETPTKPSTVWTVGVFLAGGGTENKDV